MVSNIFWIISIIFCWFLCFRWLLIIINDWYCFWRFLTFSDYFQYFLTFLRTTNIFCWFVIISWWFVIISEYFSFFLMISNFWHFSWFMVFLAFLEAANGSAVGSFLSPLIAAQQPHYILFNLAPSILALLSALILLNPV